MLTITATDLPRFMRCNGSRNMAASFPQVESDPTMRNEGDAAHWGASQIFYGKTAANLLNTKAFNDVLITQEMLDFIEVYLSALTFGEMEVNTDFNTGEKTSVNGRVDHRFYDIDINTLYIDDFKYGWGLVEPIENWTMIAHAIGTCIREQITPATIVFRVHQPRPYHPEGTLRTWSCSYERLMQYYDQIVQTMAAPLDILVTGQAWCKNCHALATCPAANGAAMNAIDASDRMFTDSITDDALSFQLDTLRRAQAAIDTRLTALEEMATYRLKHGTVIKNYATEPQYANTRFVSGISADALGLVTGIDCSKKTMASPNECKKRGVPEAVIKSLTERPLTGIKLVRVNADKRAKKLLNGAK